VNQPNRGPAIVDTCRSLQIPRSRDPKRIYREYAATLARVRAEFGPTSRRVSRRFAACFRGIGLELPRPRQRGLQGCAPTLAAVSSNQTGGCQ
jgi:hypothetical protein